MIYWIVTTVFCLIAWVSLFLLKRAPVTLRLYLVFTALASWLVPWERLINSVAQQLSSEFVEKIGLTLLSVRVSNSEATTMANSNGLEELIVVCFSWLVVGAIFIGLISFIRDGILFRNNVNQPLEGKVKKFVTRFGPIRRPLQVIKSSQVSAASLSGWLRLRVVIPQYFSDTQVRTALHHEINHIRLGDTFANVIVLLFERLLWWHPLVKSLCRSAYSLIEMRCDERCAKHFGAENYAINLAELFLTKNQASSTAFSLSVSSKPSLMRQRMEMINMKSVFQWKEKVSLLSAIILAVTCIATPVVLKAQQSKSERARLETVKAEPVSRVGKKQEQTSRVESARKAEQVERAEQAQRVEQVASASSAQAAAQVTRVEQVEKAEKEQRQTSDVRESAESSSDLGVTFLTVQYELSNKGSTRTRTFDVSFRGAQEQIEQLYQVARDLPVDVTSKLDHDGRHIALVVRDEESYQRIADVFSGTEIETIFNSLQGDDVASEQAISLAIEYQQDQQAAQKFEMHSKNQHWASFEANPYRIELKPSLTLVDGEQRILLNAKLVDTAAGNKIIAEPALMVLPGSEAAIEVGEEDAQGQFKGFKMSVTATVL
ncbi:M56 family metallopeptidase [Pleionea litopenaei]|uniref:M56 family metallopeptidase n=1 Tax=Pleionea litopenaei TaxID=3070815 RepID=A0AA51X8B7_9GAMM|nr:M56 family metallopeptidase [Pleionea sp. HL-JVS1]WMS88764.1 M56 family metallopeptidase [Pleionea sp. HL-JVS1]